MKKRTNNPRGYIGLIALLVVVFIAVFWMLYLWRTQWFKSPALNINGTNNENGVMESKDASQQLNNLREDVKQLQDKKDQEIYDAMGE